MVSFPPLVRYEFTNPFAIEAQVDLLGLFLQRMNGKAPVWYQAGFAVGRSTAT